MSLRVPPSGKSGVNPTQVLVAGTQHATNHIVNLSFEDFTHKTDELGLTELALIQASIRDENLLGSGGEAHVFQTPLDDYVLRIIRTIVDEEFKLERDTPRVPYYQFINGLYQFTPFEPVADPLPNLNVGQAIAQTKGIKILKAQHGTRLGISAAVMDMTDLQKVRQASLWIYRKLIDLPIESYLEYFRTIKILHEGGYEYDTDLTNILLDEEAGKLLVTDVDLERKNLAHRFFGEGCLQEFKPESLIHNLMPLYPQVEEDKEMQQLQQALYKKILYVMAAYYKL